MPYIDASAREAYKQGKTRTPGELSYAISQEIRAYLDGKVISYSLFNEVVGVLECLKHELIRRKLDPYEDQKHAKNGDIW